MHDELDVEEFDGVTFNVSLDTCSIGVHFEMVIQVTKMALALEACPPWKRKHNNFIELDKGNLPPLPLVQAPIHDKHINHKHLKVGQ